MAEPETEPDTDSRVVHDEKRCGSPVSHRPHGWTETWTLHHCDGEPVGSPPVIDRDD